MMDFFAHRKSARRILALWFLRLPTDRLQRKARGAHPLVVAQKIDNALCLSAVDLAAAKIGLRPGMTLADARARVLALDVAEADEIADRKLLEAIAEWCDRFTPFVAIDAPHGLFLDITGAAHLFGGERGLLERVEKDITRQGFALRLAIAGTCVAARALAHYASGTIVPSGEEEVAMAPLPVISICPNDHIARIFRRAGLKTVGQVAGRQRGELTSRFGADFVTNLDRALGHEESPISPRRHLADYAAEHRFAEPIATQACIEESLSSLAAALGKILEERGEGARRLEASFFRSDGIVRRIAIETGVPLRDSKIVLRLFRERMDALIDPLDPGFGFDLIRLEASRTQTARSESADFDSDAKTKREIAILTDSLAARFGVDRVMVLQPQDTHIPEAEFVLIPAQHATTSKLPLVLKREPGEAPLRPLRMLSKPEPVEHAVADFPDAPPKRFDWRRVRHTVRRAEGPERIAMEWWKHQEAMPTRDYYRVEDTDGCRFWLYREGLYNRETDRPRWFMHGEFA
jgi:protein ImuB